MNKCSGDVYICGEGRIIAMDNLKQNDPYIAGNTIPVKVEVHPCEEVSFANAGRLGAEAGEEFKERLGLKFPNK